MMLTVTSFMNTSCLCTHFIFITSWKLFHNLPWYCSVPACSFFENTTVVLFHNAFYLFSHGEATVWQREHQWVRSKEKPSMQEHQQKLAELCWSVSMLGLLVDMDDGSHIEENTVFWQCRKKNIFWETWMARLSLIHFEFSCVVRQRLCLCSSGGSAYHTRQSAGSRAYHRFKKYRVSHYKHF